MKIRLIHPAIGEFAFPLKPGASLILGRIGAKTDVEITWDPRISRRHCRLWEKDGRVWIQDLGSKNGSWIGTEKITGVSKIEPDNVVLIGETALLIPSNQEVDDTPSVNGLDETHEEALSLDQIEALANFRKTPKRKASSITVLPARATEHQFLETNFQNTETEPHLDIAQIKANRVQPPKDISAKPEPSLEEIEDTRPILVNPNEVLIKITTPEQLQQLWEKDLSKGGLFVQTDILPDPNTQIQIRIVANNSELTLNGTIVHILDQETAKKYQTKSGVGIHLSNLADPVQNAIRQYIEGNSDNLSLSIDMPDQETVENAESIIAEAKKLLDEAENTDFYTALGLASNCSQDQIAAATGKKHKLLMAAANKISPPQSARIRAALNVLGRMRRILLCCESRIEYDFRKGHIRADQRLKEARGNNEPSMATLREIWNRVFPDKVREAAAYTRQAFEARQRQDFLGAIESAKQALQLNPFFEELRQNVEAWESYAENA